MNNPLAELLCYQHPQVKGLRSCPGCEQRLCADCLANSDFCSEKCRQAQLRERWRYGIPVIATLFADWLLLKAYLAQRHPLAEQVTLFTLSAVWLFLGAPSLEQISDAIRNSRKGRWGNVYIWSSFS